MQLDTAKLTKKRFWDPRLNGGNPKIWNWKNLNVLKLYTVYVLGTCW